MQRPGEVVYALAVLLVAVGVAVLPVTLAVPPWALGAGVVVLTLAVLLWQSAARRAARREASVIVFSRAPWMLLALMLVLVGISAVLQLWVPLNGRTSGFYVLAYFLGILGYGAFLSTTLLFWVADARGLTRQMLAFRATLPWERIDWIYPTRAKHSQTAYGIPLARWTEETLIVEAGPIRKLVLPLRAPLAGGDARPLLEAIHRYATQAAFGFDQLPRVREAREGTLMTRSAGTQFGMAGPTDLAGAVGQARTGVVPPQWALFALRARAIWSNMVAMLLLGAFSLGVGIYFFTSGTILLPQILPPSWLGPSLRPSVALGELALFALLGLWLLWLGFGWIRRLRQRGDYFFLVTPDVFAEVKGEKVTGARLADVRAVALESGGMYGQQLVVRLASGKKLSYDFGGAYGPVRDLYGYLLAARNQRAQSHAAGPMGNRLESDQ
jgi:hypothetical protein